MNGRGAGDRVSRWEIALAALTLFMFTEAFVPKLFAPPPEATVAAGDDKLLRYLWLPFYALVGVGLVLAGRRAWSGLVRSPWLILLAVMAIASTAWSIDSEMTMRRGIAVLATTLLGVYIAARFDWLGGLRLLGGMWFAVMAATLASGVVAPGFALMTEVHVGAWAGGWWEKNQLGGHAARAAFLFAFLMWRDDAWRRWWIAGLVVALALVGLSTSATALLGTLVGFGVLVSAWWMVRGRARSVVWLWLGGSTVGLFAVMYAFAPGVLLGLIGREPTLTGRTDIWVELVRAIGERPWLGYGYQAFWGLDSEPRYWLQKAVDWDAPSGHNGWLDLAISLGFAGVVVFAIDLALTLWRAVRTSMVSPVGVFALGALAQYLLFAMSESMILSQNSIIWATYAMISAKLAMDGARVVSRVQSMTPQRAAPSVGVASTAP